jgi:hypothetical protein
LANSSKITKASHRTVRLWGIVKVVSREAQNTISESTEFHAHPRKKNTVKTVQT